MLHDKFHSPKESEDPGTQELIDQLTATTSAMKLDCEAGPAMPETDATTKKSNLKHSVEELLKTELYFFSQLQILAVR